MLDEGLISDIDFRLFSQMLSEIELAGRDNKEAFSNYLDAKNFPRILRMSVATLETYAKWLSGVDASKLDEKEKTRLKSTLRGIQTTRARISELLVNRKPAGKKHPKD